MTTFRTDRSGGSGEPSGRQQPASDGRPPGRPRQELVLALTAAAAALCAGVLDDSADLWVLLDLAALLAAGSAVAVLLRGVSVARRQPALADVATAAVTAAISGAVWLLARHGPQAEVGTLLLGTAAVMGAVLTVLVLGGAIVQLRRGSAGGRRTAPGAAPGTPAAGRAVALATVAASAVAVAAALRDALVR